MKRFEYKTVKVKVEYDNNSSTKSKGLKELFIADEEGTVDTNEMETIFNELGNQGWELVSTTEKNIDGFTTILIGIFKREV